MRRLLGQGVSAGRAEGEAIVLSQRRLDVRYRVSASDVGTELARLDAAVERSRDQLRTLRRRVEATTKGDQGAIFDAQLLMLDDPMVLERAADLIRSERISADWALQRVWQRLAERFDHIEDPYLRERAGDVGDVVGRLRLNLRDGSDRIEQLLTAGPGPFVLVADELSPSVAAQIDWQRVVGFALTAGSWTHHTAILARSLGVPAIIGLRHAPSEIRPGTWLLLDGDSGTLVVDPPRGASPTSDAPSRSAVPRATSGALGGPAMTTDGRAIRLDANIQRPEEVAAVRHLGGCGVGLYRSEYLLAGASPEDVTEDRQFAVYRRVLDGMAPLPVTIRTFGVAEQRDGCDNGTEPGWARWSGLHAIRRSLAHRDDFRCQLRALLRAACHGDLRILFPLVSGVEEVRAANLVLAEARSDLTHRGVPVGEVQVGAMIEVPSAALTVDRLVPDVDFLSIGTNDLVQFCLGVDRDEPAVSHRDEPFHPAMLRLIRMVVRSGRRCATDVSVCGEMAAEPLSLGMLIGLGVTSFSMRAAAIPGARAFVQGASVEALGRAARRAMRGATGGEVRETFAALVGRLVSAQEATTFTA